MAVMSKSALTVTSLTTAMLFGGGLYLFLNFGSIAKQLTQDYATRTLGVKVSIGRMDVSFKDRTIHVGNVKIANPKGYKKSHAATINAIKIQAGALGTELLEFKDISVSGTDVYLEVHPKGTNLTDIRNNLNTKVGASENKGEKAIKVILDKLVMNGTVHPSVTMLNSDLKPIELPTIRLNGIGRKENGVLVGEALGQVWKVISKDVMRSANTNGYLEGLSSDVLKDIGQSQIDNIKTQIDGEVDKLKNSLKNIFE